MSDVQFVRREGGKIVSWGHMHNDHIDAEKEAGVDIEVVDEPYVPGPMASDKRVLIFSAIAAVLAATDHYFTADALENISQQDQAAWQEYRKSLRAVAKLTDAKQMLAALPKSDPKGVDRFGSFR